MKKTILVLFPLITFFIACESDKKEMEVSSNSEEKTDSTTIDTTSNNTDEVAEEELNISRPIAIYGDWYGYVTENYDSISPSISLIDSSYYGGLDLCHFEQLFEGGIQYEYGGCGEGGETEHIVFPGISKVKMYNIINTHFFLEDNTWNEDSTEYEADGAGCYYSIIEKQDTIVISTYCGC